MSRKDLLKGLTSEQVAKAKACKSQDELLTLAKSEGIELTDEQLEAVAGGGAFCSDTRSYNCPKCSKSGGLVNKGNDRYYCEFCKSYCSKNELREFQQEKEYE